MVMGILSRGVNTRCYNYVPIPKMDDYRSSIIIHFQFDPKMDDKSSKMDGFSKIDDFILFYV